MTPPRVAIVGSGPAGVRAAEVLVRAGLRPVVLDEAPRSGGQIYRRAPEALRRDARQVYGFERKAAARLHAAFDAIEAQVHYRPEALVWDVAERILHYADPGGAAAIEWDALILATGAIDRVIPFPGWTLPGVFTLGGAQASLKSQAAAIGRRPLFYGTGPLLYLVAWQYLKAGIRPVAVLDTSPLGAQCRAAPRLALAAPAWLAKGLYYVAALRSAGVPVHNRVTPVRAWPDEAGDLRAFEWQDARGRSRRFECDGLASGFQLVSQTQIADLLGLEFAFDSLQRQWLPQQDEGGRARGRSGIYLAGDGARVLGADAAELTGRQTALSLLEDFGLASSGAAGARVESRIAAACDARQVLDASMFPYPADIARSIADDVMICRCEGVTAGAVRAATTELGAIEINRAKAFTRVGMGRCQGRICASAAAEIAAAALAVPLEWVGRLRGQAPLKPVSLAALAGSAP